eukprot:14517826-Alexandrium_andersonii.AAC.1
MEGGSQSGRRARQYVRARSVDRELARARATQRSVATARRTGQELAHLAEQGRHAGAAPEADALLDGMIREVA